MHIHNYMYTQAPIHKLAIYVASIEATKWITVTYIQGLSDTYVDIHYIANDSTAQGFQLLCIPPLTDE